jgi:hypothetical protein
MEHWRALKTALQEQAKVVFADRGESVQVTPDPESETALLLNTTTNSMTVTYIPERNVVKWETAREYGFERIEEPVASVAAVLTRRLFLA